MLLAGVGAVVFWRQERPPANPYAVAVKPLVEAVGPRRFFEPRLTGGFQYGALLAAERVEASVPSTRGWVFAAAARIRESALQSRSARTVAALGIAHLLVRNADEAVRLIKAAQAEQPSVASVRSDLSAAHLVRADLAGHMLERAWALEWAERALEVDPVLPEADVVHLAMHADFRITQPGRMALLLTHRVPLTTVAKWRLRSPVVVLAACDSARSADERGREGMNLVAPFLEAGASAVIGSLRPLDDADVAALFVPLHHELREAVTPADAVHAILASRKRNRSLAALSLSLYQSIG